MARKKDAWGKLVLVEFEDGIAWVTLNRPEKRNAMSPALNAEMRATVEALATDDRCKVFVLSGAGDAFAAGMDLKEYFRETDGAPDTTILNVRRTAEGNENIMPALIEAAHTYATLGEITNVLKGVFGVHQFSNIV